MKIYAGILHDTFTDENGKEVPYDDKVIAYLKEDVFKIVSIPEFMTFEKPKEEFLKMTTDLKEIFN